MTDAIQDVIETCARIADDVAIAEQLSIEANCSEAEIRAVWKCEEVAAAIRELGRKMQEE